MSILVTGATGHIGANLVRALVAQGRRVRILAHVNTRAIDGLDVEVVYGDIRHPQSLYPAFNGIETVYHLAACLSLTPTNWKEMEPVNVAGTRNIVDACLRNRVKRLVHFSSIHAMTSNSQEVLNESCQLMTISDWPPYGYSKAAGEKEVEKGLERGLNAVIIRPTAIVGPYDFKPSFFGEVLLLLARGKLPGLINGGFDWVDVRDVVDGAIQAEMTAPTGSEYLLSGQWASLKKVANITSELTGTAAPKFSFPFWVASVGAPLVTAVDHIRGRQPLYTSFSIKTIKTSPYVSHEKATIELGYQPRPLSRSIEDTLNWFKQEGMLEPSRHGVSKGSYE
jgi:dihydroflavonol-4-reductase